MKIQRDQELPASSFETKEKLHHSTVQNHHSSINQHADASTSCCCGWIFDCLKGILDAILKLFGCGEVPKVEEKEKKPLSTDVNMHDGQVEEEKKSPASTPLAKSVDLQGVLNLADKSRNAYVTADQQKKRVETAIEMIQAGNVISEALFLQMVDCYSQPHWSEILDLALKQKPKQEWLNKGFAIALENLNVSVNAMDAKVATLLFHNNADLNQVLNQQPGKIYTMIIFRENLGDCFNEFFSKRADQKIKNDTLIEAVKVAYVCKYKEYLDTARYLIECRADSSISIKIVLETKTAEAWIEGFKD